MYEKKIIKGLRVPVILLAWLEKQTKKSGRTFSAEVVHLLTLIMEGRIK